MHNEVSSQKSDVFVLMRLNIILLMLDLNGTTKILEKLMHCNEYRA